MASTNRTQYLGLSNWLESDRPKRSDFVNDNVIIDTALGLHLADSGLHLTPSEKQKATEPFRVSVVMGTGSTTSLRLDFAPSMVIVFKRDSLPTVTGNSYTTVNAGIATLSGGSGGIQLDDTLITLTQSSSASNGKFYNFSEAYAEYIVISFR